MPAENIREKIDEIALAGIQRAQGDQGSAEAIKIPDLIAADKHTAANTVAANPFRALKRARMIPPSAGRYG